MTAKQLRLLPFWLLLIAILTGCHSPTRPDAALSELAPPQERPLLILVSIDGFRADYLHLGITPVLGALAGDGARAEALRPAFPSLTFPNHYTVVTGLVPDHHGLVNNTMHDREIPGERFSLGNRDAVENPAWWNDGQPLWNTARAAGLRSATMFWPGSEAPIHGLHPHYWRTFDMSMTADERVAQVLEWVDLPVNERPHFITLYFDEVDFTGHRFGPDSDEVREAMVRTDAALGKLKAGLQQRGLWENSNLVITSDHGMADTSRGHQIILDDHVPTALFRLVAAGPLAGIEAQDETKTAELDAALSRPIPHAQCWRKDRIPARFRYGTHRRVPAWLCLADEGGSVIDRKFQEKGWIPHAGAHGYDPALDSMAALFVAHGPDFRRGVTIPELDNVDIYPLLARLLRITPEPNDGDANASLSLMRAGRDFSIRQ